MAGSINDAIEDLLVLIGNQTWDRVKGGTFDPFTLKPAEWGFEYPSLLQWAEDFPGRKFKIKTRTRDYKVGIYFNPENETIDIVVT